MTPRPSINSAPPTPASIANKISLLAEEFLVSEEVLLADSVTGVLLITLLSVELLVVPELMLVFVFCELLLVLGELLVGGT